MNAKDLARKIDGCRSMGPYVLLNSKEAKRCAIELRKVARLQKKLEKQ